MSIKLDIETEQRIHDHKRDGTGHFYAVLEIDAVSIVSLVKECYLFN